MAIWIGIAALIFFIITLFFGIAIVYLKKHVLQYHRIFAYLTLLVVSIHVVFAILLWFYGIIL